MLHLRSSGVIARVAAGDRSLAPVFDALVALGVVGGCSGAATPSDTAETTDASTDASVDAPAVVGVDAHSDAPMPVDAGVDATDEGGFVEAPHKAQPVVPYNGGSLLSTIQVVTITWAGDASAAALNAFDAWMPASSFYTSAVTQYNVHAGSQVATWSVPTAPPATFDTSQVATFLQAAVTSGAIPAPTPNTLYNFYPPPSMIVTQTYGTSVYTGCTDFQGFHDSVSVNGQTVAYAMAMRCPAWEQGLSDVDFATWGSSHEIAEAATDPFSGSGWFITDATLDTLYSGGEIGDLCDGHPTRVDGHYVTELWSNSAASADQRPCVPAPPGPMYGG